jgi:murein DD-endopeptidase MepM/ murein hydrolase activator NlpD
VVAPCGAPLLAARTGRVLRSGHDPVLYGNFLLIHGTGEAWTYFYSHLRHPPLVGRRDRVWAGQRVGVVGATGNARTVGCHLHFELRFRGRPVDPEPLLRRWERQAAGSSTAGPAARRYARSSSESSYSTHSLRSAPVES